MGSMLYSRTLDWSLENILLQKLHTRSHKVGGARLQSSVFFFVLHQEEIKSSTSKTVYVHVSEILKTPKCEVDILLNK